jgi:hypothetical protein
MTEPKPAEQPRHRAPEASLSDSERFDPARVARWREQAAATRSALRTVALTRPRGR